MDYVCARLYEFLGLLHIPKRSPTSIVDEYRSEEQDEEQPITLLALPTELLVHIISFISTTRDRAKLRCVSRRLRSVIETPSLWREFVWPYYHTSDEGCVTNVLKACGEHIMRLAFPHHVMPYLVNLAPYCSNVVELSLPTTKLLPNHVGFIMKNMKHLQKLDLKWGSLDIMQLLIKIGVHVTLKELTIRLQNSVSGNSVIGSWNLYSWLHYWSALKQFVPQRINIVKMGSHTMGDHSLENSLYREWKKCNSDSPAGHTGYLKIYNHFRMPMNLVPTFPVFQLEFGQTSCLPYVSASTLAQPIMANNDHEDLLLLLDGLHGSKIEYRGVSSIKFPYDIDYKYLNCNVTNLNSVVELDFTFCQLYSDHLEHFSIVCPNLQRLNLQYSDSLKSLHGLHVIANSCHYLHGLNLMNICLKDVEDQMQLWEILSDIKLTHLALDLCILLPSTKSNKKRLKLISLFQKCVNLQALETMACCHKCSSRYVDNSMLLLSHLPSLQHLIINAHNHSMTFMQNIFSSCKKLRYFITTFHVNEKSLDLLSASSCHLQQLCIQFINAELSGNFMNTISVHGGLVHVLLCVASVTSESVAVLVMNSPNLLTLHIYLYHSQDHLKMLNETLDATLKVKMSQRKLFTCGSYKIVRMQPGYVDNDIVNHEHLADLLSFW